jgi:hypothetical protein
MVVRVQQNPGLRIRQEMHPDFLLFNPVSRAESGGAPCRAEASDGKKQEKKKTRMCTGLQSVSIVAGEP